MSAASYGGYNAAKDEYPDVLSQYTSDTASRHSYFVHDPPTDHPDNGLIPPSLFSFFPSSHPLPFLATPPTLTPPSPFPLYFPSFKVIDYNNKFICRDNFHNYRSQQLPYNNVAESVGSHTYSADGSETSYGSYTDASEYT
jgi:hypothetical protein